MSARTLEQVLAEHEPYSAQGGVYCECGNWDRHFDDSGSPETYAAHVAAEVRAWITERLAGEGLRESVSTALSAYEDTVDYLEDTSLDGYATAALTTIAEHLTNEQEAPRG